MKNNLDYWKNYRSADEIRQDEQDDDGILAYMDAENPQRCPLCGSSNVEVRYVEWMSYTGETVCGDRFQCPDCNGQGDYE